MSPTSAVRSALRSLSLGRRFAGTLALLLAFWITTEFGRADDRRPERFIYNSDANHMYYYKTPPMSVSDLQECVDEVTGTGVTTFFASPNWGMFCRFPSRGDGNDRFDAQRRSAR